ncbi:TPA: hypothetical protein ODL66_004110 [Escherichia coli]|nr:hypothetical protein [Escherichia coli]
MAVVVKADLSKIPSISGNNGYSLRCEEVKINGESAYCSYSFASTPFLPSKKTVFLELHSSRAQPLSKQANARR